MKMKHYTIKFKIVEIESNNFHIFAKANIGKKIVNLVIDTGASHTCFDINFIRNLKQEATFADTEGMNVGVASVGFETKTTALSEFKIGKFVIPEYQIILLDMLHINEAYKQIGLPAVHGILGGDFFTKYHVTIDYMKSEMTLWTNN